MPARKSFERANKFERRLTFAYLVSGSLTGLSYCVRPLIANLINGFVYDSEYSYEMPMKASFLYDITKSPAYEITYASYCYAVYLTVLLSVSC